jgi:hypothetical protein
MQGLFRGGSMRMMYLFIGGSAFFGLYEKARDIIDSNISSD